LDNGQLKKPTEDLQTQLKRQLSMVFKTVGLGFALGGASVWGVRLLIQHPTKAKWIRNTLLKMFPKWSLTGEKLNQVRSGVATLVFWSAPAYVGWVHAARTDSERKEWWLKFANSTAWFFGTPILTAKLVKPFNEVLSKFKIKMPVEGTKTEFSGAPSFATLDDKLQPLLLKKFPKDGQAAFDALRVAKTNNYMFGLAFSIVMLGLTPQLLNRYLTKKRYEARKQQLEEQHLTTHPAPPKPEAKWRDMITPPPAMVTGWNPWTMQSREPWGTYPYQQSVNASSLSGWPAPQYYAGY